MAGGFEWSSTGLAGPAPGPYVADVDPDEAREDRRRRQRIRANAALLGLPPLTPREFREAARDPVSRAKWSALSAQQRAVTIAVLVTGLIPLLAALYLMGSGDGHTGAVILLV